VRRPSQVLQKYDGIGSDKLIHEVTFTTTSDICETVPTSPLRISTVLLWYLLDLLKYLYGIKTMTHMTAQRDSQVPEQGLLGDIDQLEQPTFGSKVRVFISLYLHKHKYRQHLHNIPRPCKKYNTCPTSLHGQILPNYDKLPKHAVQPAVPSPSCQKRPPRSGLSVSA